MNYLSHYYFDQHDERPHYILGLILPDLIRTFNRERVHKQKVEIHWQKPIQNLQEGINKHHHIDELFHSSTFFKSHNKRVFQQLQDVKFEGVTKYTHFVSHVLIEMLLDRFLMQENEQLASTFYYKLNSTEKRNLVAYFNQFPAVKDNFEDFWKFIRRFCNSQFLIDYQEREGIVNRLNRVMQRITHQAFTPKDQVKLYGFVGEVEADLKLVYREIFEELK
ncbi:MAG: hypothetical protein AB8B69_13450 [Chitinophagales bacterium]